MENIKKGNETSLDILSKTKIIFFVLLNIKKVIHKVMHNAQRKGIKRTKKIKKEAKKQKNKENLQKKNYYY